MSDWDEWSTDEIIDLHLLIDAADRMDKDTESLILEIGQLSILRRILIRLNPKKLNNIKKKLEDIIVVRMKVNDSVES